jgi:biopolymer transport protein ExbB
VIHRWRLAVLVAAAAVGPAPGVRGETLDDLLQATKNAGELEIQANAAREAEFLAARDRQRELVEEARRERDRLQARSRDLSTRFDQNEIQLNELETLLDARQGNLGELFGVTRQVAGDLSGVVYNSLISAQFPDRGDFLAKLAKSKALPARRDLERLWYEMLREMTESGRVARFRGPLVTEEGEKQEAEMVRIGGFIATAGDRYLAFEPGANTLTALPRQPDSELRELAEGLQEAERGYAPAIVDPSRGVLLSLVVQRPGVWERIEKGEAVGYVILSVGGVGALCAIYQFLALIRVRLAVRRQLLRLDEPRPDNPLGRVLASFQGNPERIDEDVEVVELRISEAVLRELPALERFQGFLRLAVAAGPLLGLIGTVIGMIITFQSITESGSSDPKLMATGIGQAMIATVLGLGIAIPLLFANAALGSLSDGLVQVLDEQSTGILARQIERRKSELERAED